MAKKRAFIKYTKKGKIIPGSLIVTTNGGYPVDGLYKEVSVDLCCDDTNPCTPADYGDWKLVTGGVAGDGIVLVEPIDPEDCPRFTFIGPNDDGIGANDADDGWVYLKQYFPSTTCLEIEYRWTSHDDSNPTSPPSVDWPVYWTSTTEPTGAPSDDTVRVDSTPDGGTWNITVPGGQWFALGIYSSDSCCGRGFLQVEICEVECPEPTTTSTSSSTTTTTTTEPPEFLRLLFNSIENTPVADPTNVNNWNTFFDLPALGSPFTSVQVVGNEVRLFGGSNITLKNQAFKENLNIIEFIDGLGFITNMGFQCFSDATSLTTVYLPQVIVIGSTSFLYCTSLVSVNIPLATSAEDGAFAYCTALPSISLPSLVTATIEVFYECTSLTSINFPQLVSTNSLFLEGCTSLTSISLPSLVDCGNGVFRRCTSLTNISLPSCINLGQTVGDDLVFFNINGNNITLTIPAALMTADSGNPDGDIVYLQANNTVTIITV